MAAEALKRLKPAPKDVPQRSDRAITKADRRHDGQRRQNRNAGPRPQRLHAAKASRSTVPRAVRTETGAAAAGASRRRIEPQLRQQRHPQRGGAHTAHRPDGGQGKPKFRGRRRFGGGNRAQG